MARKRTKPEQVVTLLRQIEVAVANGKTTPQACKEAEVTEQSYYRWRKEYGGLKLNQARRLKELEKENARLKRVVADYGAPCRVGYVRVSHIGDGGRKAEDDPPIWLNEYGQRGEPPPHLQRADVAVPARR